MRNVAAQSSILSQKHGRRRAVFTLADNTALDKVWYRHRSWVLILPVTETGRFESGYSLS